MKVGVHTHSFLSRPVFLPVLARILVVATITYAAAITWPRKAEVAARELPRREVPKAVFEIVGPKTLRYNYDKLISSENRERISVAVRNLVPRKQVLTGSVEMHDVVDPEGKAVQLIFRMVTLDPQGKFQKEISTTKISPNAIKVLTFELLTLAYRLRPGSYKGEVRVTATTKKIQPVIIPMMLTVPGANLKIVMDENQSYDYLDLASHGYHSFVSVTLRNNGNTARSINANLIGQKDILSVKGTPINLTFQRVVLDEKGEPLCSDRPVRIDAGDAVTLHFKLQDSAVQPAPGTYNAFLVVTVDDGSKIEPDKPLSICVPSKNGVNPTTYGKAFWAWLQQWPKRYSPSWLGEKPELDPVLWIILLVVSATGMRCIVLYLRRHRVGTIEIENVVDATDQQLKTEGLKALLKATLENLGLNPPAPQPLSSISIDVGDIVTKMGAPETGIVKAVKEIWKFVWDIFFPTVGHKTCVTLRTSTKPPIEAIVEMKHARTGRTEGIKSGLLAETAEEAMRKVAYFIYLHAMDQKNVRERTPEWARFGTLEGFESYQVGKAKPANDTTAAIYEYTKAANRELNNAIIRLALGSALVGCGRFLEAMELYLHVVTRWPEMIESRYRLAVAFSFSHDLMRQWEDLKDEERKEELLRLLLHHINNDAPIKSKELCNYIDLSNPNKILEEPYKDFFLKLACFQWAYLSRQLEGRVRFGAWWSTLNPMKRKTDIRNYLWTFSQVWPLGLKRRQYKRAVEVAKYCTEIQLNPESEKVTSTLNKVDSLFCSVWRSSRLGGMTWIAHYNAACAYSLSLALQVGSAQQRQDWEKNGVDRLRAVIRDPGSAPGQDWLFSQDHGDPDLEHLRQCSTFKLWKPQVRAAKPAPVPPEPKQQPPHSEAEGLSTPMWFVV